MDYSFHPGVVGRRVVRMDDTLAVLATSGSQTIVSLMATDAWTGVKSLATRIFSHKDARTGKLVGQELEASRARVLDADNASSRAIRQQELDRWEARLRLCLLEDEGVAHLITELIEAVKTQQVVGSAGRARITLRAEAKGKARIFQQGQGIQYNG
jgi:aspartate oxidase